MDINNADKSESSLLLGKASNSNNYGTRNGNSNNNSNNNNINNNNNNNNSNTNSNNNNLNTRTATNPQGGLAKPKYSVPAHHNNNSASTRHAPQAQEGIVVVETLTTVIAVTQAIYQAAQEIKANNASCAALGERINDVTEVLQQLDKLTDNDQYTKTLNKYHQLLTRCSAFMQEYASIEKKGFIARNATRYYHKNDNKAQIDGFNLELDNMRSDLILALNVQILFDRDQDKNNNQAEFEHLKTSISELYGHLNTEAENFVELKQNVNNLSTITLQCMSAKSLEDERAEDIVESEQTYENARVVLGNGQYLQAFGMFCSAANKGYPAAPAAVAAFYLNPSLTGNVVLEDRKVASTLIYKSAKMGDMRAQTDYAQLLEKGEVVAQDVELAKKLYVLAAEKGETTAEKRCGELQLQYKKRM